MSIDSASWFRSFRVLGTHTRSEAAPVPHTRRNGDPEKCMRRWPRIVIAHPLHAPLRQRAHSRTRSDARAVAAAHGAFVIAASAVSRGDGGGGVLPATP